MAEKDLQNKANIRFLQAVSDTQYVDVFINKELVVDWLPFQSVSNYVSLLPGTYTIDILSSTDRKNKLLSTNIIIQNDQIYTLVLVGKGEETELYMVHNFPKVPFGEAKMRFLHLAPELPTIDFAVKDRDVVFENIAFQQVTDYLGLTPMTVDLELRTAGSKQVILPMPKLKFKANEACTIVLVGSKKEFSIIIIID
ncbi:DUF4397 domain-containing protein [Neobacillus sp. PS3-12]|jgi:hypothetical protein|uniref:DUF4397 domain-containing protein n=1 Tax=Neobacillus sp. PS3-12 TaxID=3070677 RepID=UPI0027E17D5C|nr:DUF4397 domain-containing protein [Neobacillus sp. PS3-12]WML53791.1 DUF4397 domain-containing protein [Neobacillus sp. PS3-12]